jgi:hypothetical protein
MDVPLYPFLAKREKASFLILSLVEIGYTSLRIYSYLPVGSYTLAHEHMLVK